MTITLSTVSLSAGGLESPSNLSITESRNVQRTNPVRARAVKFIGRKNRSLSISFTVSRVHADLLEAQKFVLDHCGTVPDSGTLIIETEPDGNVAKRKMYDACVDNISIKHVGVSTETQYSLSGGEIVIK
jgi:hypothetical protein